MSILRNMVIDCADVERQAQFWSAATGYPIQQRYEDHIALALSPTARPRLLVIKVPDPKTVKNRVHLDLGADDVEAEVERLVGLGATSLERVENYGESWVVLADPEGNEFCVVRERP